MVIQVFKYKKNTDITPKTLYTRISYTLKISISGLIFNIPDRNFNSKRTKFLNCQDNQILSNALQVNVFKIINKAVTKNILYNFI